MRSFLGLIFGFRVFGGFFSFLFLDGCFETDTDFYGNNVGEQYDIENPKDCQTLCQNNNECNFWTLSNSCWLKTTDSGRQSKLGVTSGPKFCSKLITGSHGSVKARRFVQ